jgi:hypothetical protein
MEMSIAFSVSPLSGGSNPAVDHELSRHARAASFMRRAGLLLCALTDMECLTEQVFVGSPRFKKRRVVQDSAL